MVIAGQAVTPPSPSDDTYWRRDRAGFQSQFQAHLSSDSVDALWPSVLDPWVSPPPALFWLQTGSRVPAPKYSNVTKYIHQKGSLGFLSPSGAFLCHFSQDKPSAGRSAGHSKSPAQSGLQGGEGPAPSSQLRAPSQSPKSGSQILSLCPSSSRGHYSTPQRPLFMRLAIAQAWAHRSGLSGASVHFLGSEIHSDSGAQETLSQKQRHSPCLCPLSVAQLPAVCLGLR